MPLFSLPVPLIAAGAPKLYDLKGVICSVGPVTINGYGEEDAISFEWAAPLIDETVFADGTVAVTRTNDRRLYARISLMSTSGAIPQLATALELQHGDIARAAGSAIPLPFFLMDITNGDVVAGTCFFMSHPLPNKRREVGDLEWRLMLPNPSIQLGSFNVV